jgi:threonine aldolase
MLMMYRSESVVASMYCTSDVSVSLSVGRHRVVARCREQGVLVSAVGPGLVRVVTHLDVTAEQAKRAAEVIAAVVAP